MPVPANSRATLDKNVGDKRSESGNNRDNNHNGLQLSLNGHSAEPSFNYGSKHQLHSPSELNLLKNMSNMQSPLYAASM